MKFECEMKRDLSEKRLRDEEKEEIEKDLRRNVRERESVRRVRDEEKKKKKKRVRLRRLRRIFI